MNAKLAKHLRLMVRVAGRHPRHVRYERKWDGSFEVNPWCGRGDYLRLKRSLRKFKTNPRYPHHRSEGMTHRRNGGSRYQDANV